ncbi:hypothetical protein [Rhizobium sp. SSA_523]|uniref:hypothetical protein n=1 Tax=Rhizobium sp. SSA_523 TaxID=2952477 RepID=UPI00209165AB|nr:hypothetical protein [Rhizobium sp. SSA_523]MCO5731067.1 hypothetical protein [Rhizobium sp. SSA_523]WKC24132.1 hypothetical protein QTJ18_08600 [Rhizobium sp. SSA_523]
MAFGPLDVVRMWQNLPALMAIQSADPFSPHDVPALPFPRLLHAELQALSGSAFACHQAGFSQRLAPMLSTVPRHRSKAGLRPGLRLHLPLPTVFLIADNLGAI